MNVQPQEPGFAPDEDPFKVQHGGFYRRWLSMFDDLGELRALVGRLEATTEEDWVPLWRAAGGQHEEAGDRLEAAGDHAGARKEYLEAKTYYAIARFPGEISPLKAEASADCARAYRKASRHLDPPLEIVEVACDGRSIRAHFRAPRSDRPVPAVLIMCGSDVFKEDRGWAAEMALSEGLASLVMDAPGTGENPFPWEPDSVRAWVAAIDWLAARPEIDAGRIGAFGISRGGYSVMQLAGTYPEMVRAVVAVAGHPFGYRLSEAETAAVVEARNRRRAFVFGPAGGGPSFPEWSAETEAALFRKWALSELGILDRITQPILMINGKHDHLAPIGNIYFMLEHGPVTGREARVYADAGHCAFKYYREWAPASFRWLKEKLSRLPG
ncbi:alpha/beta hydrolase family protein [Propylenella binzhouense]|uniref:Alpha/beta hydrolase n=1 Tax=Propylenella binzhouense TaxID=2555902 RepID=A0A964T5U1_9HYPH|nr:alpha/beta fold hydrolase [Propylenella binzhouense]MYZ48359.1 alpha/beta hydrolase [Propylenella binzhouense]